MSLVRRALLIDLCIVFMATSILVGVGILTKLNDPPPLTTGCPCPQDGAECTVSGFSVPNNSATVVTFTGANWDTSGGTYWDGTNKNRLNGKAAASTPLLFVTFSFAQSGADGVFSVSLFVGATQVAQWQEFVTGGKVAIAGTLNPGKVQLPASGAVSVQAFQSTGAAVNGNFTLDMEF